MTSRDWITLADVTADAHAVLAACRDRLPAELQPTLVHWYEESQRAQLEIAAWLLARERRYRARCATAGVEVDARHLARLRPAAMRSRVEVARGVVAEVERRLAAGVLPRVV